MEYRTLGRTGLRVSALGFGGAEIGFEDASEVDVDRIVGAAIDAGINVFDTGECYADSEEKLGRALASRRSDVLVFTKCGHASGLPGEDWSRPVLEASIDRSLQRLRTDHVDLLQLHSCSRDVLEQGDAIDVLQRARAAGKTSFIGYSGDAEDARYAVELGVFDTLQTSVNIADQQSIDLTIQAAAARGMGVIAKRAIANAAWKYDDLPEDAYAYTYMQRLRRLDYPFLREPVRAAVSQALRFTLAVPGVSLAIIGTKSPERWLENSRMLADGALDPAAFGAIRSRWQEVSGPDWTGQV